MCPLQIQTAVERLIPSPSDRRLLLVCIDADAAQVAAVLRRVKGGQRQSLESLAAQCDYAAVQKLYKITDAELRLPPQSSPATWANAIASRIATK